MSGFGFLGYGSAPEKWEFGEKNTPIGRISNFWGMTFFFQDHKRVPTGYLARKFDVRWTYSFRTDDCNGIFINLSSWTSMKMKFWDEISQMLCKLLNEILNCIEINLIRKQRYFCWHEYENSQFYLILVTTQIFTFEKQYYCILIWSLLMFWFNWFMPITNKKYNHQV